MWFASEVLVHVALILFLPREDRVANIASELTQLAVDGVLVPGAIRLRREQPAAERTRELLHPIRVVRQDLEYREHVFTHKPQLYLPRIQTFNLNRVRDRTMGDESI